MLQMYVDQDIPHPLRRLVKQHYTNWILSVCLSLFNFFVNLFVMLQALSLDGGVGTKAMELGVSAVYVTVLPISSLLFWYLPAYVAAKRNSGYRRPPFL